MYQTTRISTYWHVVLWGREPRKPMSTISPKWFAIGTLISLSVGAHWFTLLVLATWNSLVHLRNRWRCPEVN